MLADNPTIYRKEKKCTDFIASLPSVFDEMCCLQGEMGKYLVMARRKGPIQEEGLMLADERELTFAGHASEVDKGVAYATQGGIDADTENLGNLLE